MRLSFVITLAVSIAIVAAAAWGNIAPIVAS